MKIPVSLWLLASLGATFLPGCRAKTSFPGAASIEPIPVVPAPMPVSPFQVTARAAKAEFPVGEAIALEIEIKNLSDQPADLNFTSGQKFDFSAIPLGKTDAVWSYGMNKRFMQALSTVTLEAGKSLRFETVWNGAKPGTYTLKALIKANGGIEAAPFQIVVK